MFSTERGEGGSVRLIGRLDAAQVEKAEAALAPLSGTVILDLGGLDYIASAGIAVLLKMLKRLQATQGVLILRNLSPRIRTVFDYAGLDQVFTVE